MKDTTIAELIALGFLAVVTALMAAAGRSVAVATQDVSYTPAGGVEHKVAKGSLIPMGDLSLVLATNYRQRRLSLLRAVIVGKDNRTSTSKTVAFAWTYAIAFGLVSLIVAKWLGSADGWNKLVSNGLQEEYLLFLGGTYAAAVLAKYKAVSDAQGDTGKPAAPVGSADPKQLIADDEGDGDLGDFQYVLFNVIALGWFFGTFAPHLGDGFPDVPALLAALALTSAGGYSAKKLVGQAAPSITALQPGSVPRSTQAAESRVDIWARNLLLPAAASGNGSGSMLTPTITVGGRPAVVVSTGQPLGIDLITVNVPATVAPGVVKVVATRADGVPARGPDGTDGLTLTVT